MTSTRKAEIYTVEARPRQQIFDEYQTRDNHVTRPRQQIVDEYQTRDNHVTRPRQQIFDEYQTRDNHVTRRRHETRNRNETKKYLTNSDKSVFNLRWEVGGVAEKNYQRSRSHNLQEKPSNSQNLYYRKRPAPRNKSMPVYDSDTSDRASPEPYASYYPYAYPPEPVYEQQKTVVRRMTRPQNKTPIKQSEKTINLVHKRKELRIEHHYVDSTDEAEKLIEELRQQGYVEAGITTPEVYHYHKKQ